MKIFKIQKPKWFLIQVLNQTEHESSNESYGECFRHGYSNSTYSHLKSDLSLGLT